MISTYTSKLKQLQIGDLIAKIPIIQGGMGVGISRSHLAGAVAKEGGVGIISTAQIGYDEEGFENDQAGCNLKAIKKTYPESKGACLWKRTCGCQYYGCIKALQRACPGSSCGRGRCDYQWSRAPHESAGACQQNLPDKDSSDCILEACNPADIEDVGAPL